MAEFRAKLLVCLAGPHRCQEPGETVYGEEAARLCARGYAEPIEEVRGTAAVPLEAQTVRVRKAKAS